MVLVSSGLRVELIVGGVNLKRKKTKVKRVGKVVIKSTDDKTNGLRIRGGALEIRLSPEI